MGNKLGISLNKHQLEKLNLNKGDYVSVKIYNIEVHATFVTRFNYNITLRKSFADILKLEPDDEITVIIEPIVNLERTKEIFRNNKIDLLSLIPEKTSLGYEIFATPFKRNNKQWLRIWYAHERGSGRQIELIRYVDISAFGRILGQLQAEGTKSFKHVVFTNKLISEHKDFVNFLGEFGIRRDSIAVDLYFNKDRYDSEFIQNLVKEFETKIDTKVDNIRPARSKTYGFRTFISNTIFSEILMNAMEKTRRTISSENILSPTLKEFADGFLSKLLTGDGSLDITNNPRVIIADGNEEYREDYIKILKRLGFKAKSSKPIFVRFYCGFLKLLYLYKIKAFYGTNNWARLLEAIERQIQRRYMKPYLRIVDFIGCNFTIKEITETYNVTISGARDWIKNMKRKGMIKIVGKKSRKFLYTLTDRGYEVANQLELSLKEIEKLKITKY